MNLKMHGKIFVVDESTGERICNCGCGRVMEERIESTRQEIQGDKDRAGPNEAKRAGTQIITVKHDYNLTTTIDKANQDASGKKLNAMQSQLSFNLRVQQVRASVNSTGERRLVNSFIDLNNAIHTLGLPSTIHEQVAYVIRKIEKRGWLKNAPKMESVAACIYYICRRNDLPYNWKSFVKPLGLTRLKFLKRFVRKLLEEYEENNANVVSPYKFVGKMCNALDSDPLVEKVTYEILDVVKDCYDLIGKSPKVIAASAIYQASLIIHGEDGVKPKKYATTEFEMEKSSEVTSVSIRHIGKTIKPLIGKVLQKWKHGS